MKEQQPEDSDVKTDSEMSTHYLINDIVDLHSKSAKLSVHGREGIAMLGVSGGLTIASERIIDLPFTLDLYTSVLFGVACGRMLSTWSHEAHNSSWTNFERSQNIASDELGYRIVKLRYKGTGSFESDEVKLERNDSFMYVSLPDITVEGAGSESREESVRASFLNASLYDIQSKIDALGLAPKVICIDGYSASSLSNEKVKDRAITNREELFKDKDVVVPNAASDILVMSPEEFREFAMIPSELFVKALEGVESGIVNELIELARVSPSEDYEKITDLLDVHLSQMLHKEAELHFNGAHTKLSKEEPFYMPLKKRIERRLEIRDFGGTDFIQLTSTDGSIETIPLERALQVETLSQNEMVEEDSQFKKARSVYVLQELLAEFSLDELLNDPYKNPYQFIEKYKDRNITITVESLTDAEVEAEIIDKKKTKEYMWKKFPTNISHPLVSMLSAGAIMGGIYLAAAMQEYFPETAGESKIGGKTLFDLARFDFAGKPGGSDDIRWKVEGHGGMRTNGYYVLATTNEMTRGEWYQSYFGNDKSILVGIPTEIDNGAFIKVESYDENTLVIPIPVKNDSKLGALSIEDKEGNNLLNSVIYNVDGTYSALLEDSALNKKFHVEAYLVPSVDQIPHAAKRIEPLDQRLLSSEAQEYIQESQLEQRYSTLPQVIASDYIYNVMPEVNKTLDKDGFKKGFSREKVVNLILESNECNCNTCNTLMVLLSSVDDDNITLNLASGYLHGISNPATGKGSFLTDHSLHAFGIDDKGVIYDATGSKGVSKDKATQKFLKDNTDDEKLEDGWATKQHSFNAKPEELLISKKDLLVGLGGLIGLGAGTFAGRKGYKFLRRTITEENINKIGEQVLLTFYTDEELKRAHTFFTGLSWSKNGIISNTQQDLDKEGVAILHHMQSTINESRMHDYLDSPSKYEKSLPNGETAKMRFLARYLIGRAY